MKAARKIMRRIDALAGISNEPGVLTRTFASPAMRRANALVGRWMRAAGLQTRIDAVGNLIGHYPGPIPNARVLLLGSHLDTVRNAGKFDGPLGVILAIACVEELHRRKITLPFAIEVLGFCDEEGVRYQTTYLGSKAAAGCFDLRDLTREDAGGITMASAIKEFGGNPAQIKSACFDPAKLLGYVEAHIEQGPVLEEQNLAVGLVTGIAGQSRSRVIFVGHAGHAGTVPMALRQDALCAAAEFILAAETQARKTTGLVATVGRITAQPGVSNVISGGTILTLDVRHAQDIVRRQALKRLGQTARKIARRRKLKVTFEIVHEAAAVRCSEQLSALLERAARRCQRKVPRLPSGAGHDAAIMSRVTPVAMLFIRCKGGISHHPDESVKAADVQVAFKVMTDFILELAARHEHV